MSTNKNVFTRDEVEAIIHKTWIQSAKTFNNPIKNPNVKQFIKQTL